MTDETEGQAMQTGQIGEDLVEAMVATQRAIGSISKNRRSDGGYNFRGIDDVIAALHPIAAEHGLLMIPAIEDVDYLGKSQKTYKGSIEPGPFDLVKVHMRFTFIGPKGSTFAVPYVMLAQNMGVDKAIGSAQSYATRYLATGAFTIPAWGTEYDPETRNDNAEPPARPKRSEAPSKAKPHTLTEDEARGTIDESALPKVKLAELAKAVSDAGLEDDVVVGRANELKPGRKTPFKSLRSICQTDPALARELIELLDTGQIMNAEVEPFGVSPVARLREDLTAAAKAYKQVAGDADYSVAVMIGEIEDVEGVKIEGGLDGLVEHYPELAAKKIADLEARVIRLKQEVESDG